MWLMCFSSLKTKTNQQLRDWVAEDMKLKTFAWKRLKPATRWQQLWQIDDDSYSVIKLPFFFFVLFVFFANCFLVLAAELGHSFDVFSAGTAASSSLLSVHTSTSFSFSGVGFFFSNQTSETSKDEHVMQRWPIVKSRCPNPNLSETCPFLFFLFSFFW